MIEVSLPHLLAFLFCWANLFHLLLKDNAQLDPAMASSVLRLIERLENDHAVMVRDADQLTPLCFELSEKDSGLIESRESSFPSSRPSTPSPRLDGSSSRNSIAGSFSVAGSAETEASPIADSRRRSTVSKKQRMSGSPAKSRSASKNGTRQELSSLARKMAQELSGSERPEKADDEDEEGVSGSEYFKQDRDGELAKYLDDYFSRQGSAPSASKNSVAESESEEFVERRPERDTLLPTLEGTLKVIGLEFVLGETSRAFLQAKVCVS